MNFAARRINNIARHCGGSRYLEIGVAQGATFFDVDMPRKAAVDPFFQFDPQERLGEDRHFFPMPSDDFFDQFASRPEAEDFKGPDGTIAFDVIFIDGLHTHQQALRDFENSLRFSHEKTIWLLDDTVPNDPYSGVPDIEKCKEYRQAAGVSSLAWHGDVYRMVFVLHDLYPNFSYCTIMTDGNPQTVIWRSLPASPRKPVFPSAEIIGCLDYFSIMEYCHLFMPVLEEVFLERIGSCPDPADFQSPELWKLFMYPIRTQAEMELRMVLKWRELKKA